MDQPKLDLHTVRILQAVVEHGSITAAATALGYSQPAVSQHLRRVERRLGTPLLLRVGRGVRLTEPGRVVARHSPGILAALRAAEDELARMVDRHAGTVRLAAFPSASSTIIPPVVAQLAAAHPQLRLHYTEAEPPEALALLSEGSLDVAVTFSFPGDPADPHEDLVGTSALDLFADPVRVVLPAAHPEANRSPLRLERLAEDQWIAGCPLCRGHLLAACAGVGVNPRIAHATDNSVAVLALVAAGVGVALQPALALEPLELPHGTVVREAAPASDRAVQAHFLNGSDAVPAVAAVLATLREVTAPRRAQPAGASQRSSASRQANRSAIGANSSSA